jgi:hypothetical protein
MMRACSPIVCASFSRRHGKCHVDPLVYTTCFDLLTLTLTFPDRPETLSNDNQRFRVGPESLLNVFVSFLDGTESLLNVFVSFLDGTETLSKLLLTFACRLLTVRKRKG